MMNDDVPCLVNGVSTEVSYKSVVSRQCLLRCGLIVVSRNKFWGRRGSHHLYHHVPGLIINEIAFRVFTVRVCPFVIRIVFILTVFKRHYPPSTDELLFEAAVRGLYMRFILTECCTR